MAKTYRPYIVNQPLLLPPDLRNWLEPGHIAHFIDEVAEGLDLGAIYGVYEREERGFPPYHPEMMVKLLLYGYCTGIFSSRKIARALHENIAFRFLSRDNYPDFRTLSEFRRIHLQALSGLFMQVLRLAQETGILKLGKVALDGTKIKASASKHKAMSWKRMLKNEAELEAEIALLLAAAKRADQEDDAAGLDGLDLPAELLRREDRLLKIRAAKAALEARAAQKAAARKGDDGEPPAPGGAAGQPPTPKDNAQYNFTDPDSRLMKGGDGFIQGYNCQAGVDGDTQIIVAHDTVADENDKRQLDPMAKKIVKNLGGKPEALLADAGYCSEDALKTMERRALNAVVAVGKEKHGGWLAKQAERATRGPIPLGVGAVTRMARKLKTRTGKALYALRKIIAEPPFGQIKRCMGFRQFLLRGNEKVKSEWSLVCTAHNLLKLHRISLRLEGG